MLTKVLRGPRISCINNKLEDYGNLLMMRERGRHSSSERETKRGRKGEREREADRKGREGGRAKDYQLHKQSHVEYSRFDTSIGDRGGYHATGRDYSHADEGNWTKVVTRREKRKLKRISGDGRQSLKHATRGKTTQNHINWRNKEDITSYYFTHFPDEANEEMLWKTFKQWGEVREVYIAKCCNREGRRYGFVRFKGVTDAKRLEVKLDSIFIKGHKLFVNLPRFARSSRTSTLQQKAIDV